MEINYPNAPIVFIMGPTASGKTALAIDLYQQASSFHTPFEIISVDSAMVYRQMDIGSAKPNAKELALAPHHLIDFVDPKEAYSASQFCVDAKKLINDAHQNGKIPLLVGGTMLYFKALKDGLAEMPETDQVIRQQVKDELEKNGIEHLHRQLATFDPTTAERLHYNDSQRITRAIEVYRMTGKTLAGWHAEQKDRSLRNPLLSIALAPAERKILHQRIALRFNQMMESGFLDEMDKLYHRGDLSLDCPSMRCVGYRQIWQYLDGDLSLAEAKERAIIATRQLAKRQYTWLRSWPDAQWFDPIQSAELEQCKTTIQTFLTQQ